MQKKSKVIFIFILILVICLIGSKWDLSTDKWEISEDEVKSFAQSKGIEFCLISAKDNKGIRDLFINLVKKINNAENNKN